MKKFLFGIPVLMACLTFNSCTSEKEIAVNQQPMKWWYDVPATKYREGLPIGTGRFVAMIPGNVDHEVIPFNDETLWTGGTYNPSRLDGPQTIANIRKFMVRIFSMPLHDNYEFSVYDVVLINN